MEGRSREAKLDGQRLALALEAAALGTWTWDMASATTVWDTRLEELHGLPPGGFGGTFEDWVEALHPDDRGQCLERVEQALDNPGPYVLLHRTTWPDGSIHWIECRGRVTVDALGNPTGTVGVALDVTTRENREASMARELEEKHDLVETLQHALLPTELPSMPGITVAARYRPARSVVVGGDWYAVVPLPNGRMGLGVGDVAGHGLAAVGTMASARFSLRALALSEMQPAQVLGRLNETLQLFEGGSLVTVLYGILDPACLTWSYCNAGHCPPALRAPDGTVTVMTDPANPPMGINSVLSCHNRQLRSGSVLVLYTDGLIERRGETITAGLERLAATFGRGPQEPEALADYLLAELLNERSNDDDVALLVVLTD